MKPREPLQADDIMKYFISISVLSFLLAGCASRYAGRNDLYYLPCETKASVSFEGETQAGSDIQRLEVRRLAYVPPGMTKGKPATSSCVIYYAEKDNSPSILRVLDDCIDPLVRKTSKDTVEIYFLAGAHTHIRERWKLLGTTAKLDSEEEINWNDDPRMTNGIEQSLHPASRILEPCLPSPISDRGLSPNIVGR